MEHLTTSRTFEFLHVLGEHIDAVKIPGFWLLDGHAFQCLESRGGNCSHGIFSILFLFPALNEGCFLGILRIVQKSSKKNPKSLLLHEKAGQHAAILKQKLQYLTLVEKTAHVARDIRRKTSAATCCRTKNLK